MSYVRARQFFPGMRGVYRSPAELPPNTHPNRGANIVVAKSNWGAHLGTYPPGTSLLDENTGHPYLIDPVPVDHPAFASGLDFTEYNPPYVFTSASVSGPVNRGDDYMGDVSKAAYWGSPYWMRKMGMSDAAIAQQLVYQPSWLPWNGGNGIRPGSAAPTVNAPAALVSSAGSGATAAVAQPAPAFVSSAPTVAAPFYPTDATPPLNPAPVVAAPARAFLPAFSTTSQAAASTAAPGSGISDQIAAWMNQSLIGGIANKWLLGGIALAYIMFMPASHGGRRR